MQLYFTRHGKTEWNQEMRFQGMGGDSPLLPASYDEISLLGQELSTVPFKKIFSSTSTRARKTAEGINRELKHPVEIMYTDQLKELGLGKLEGELIQEMRKREEYVEELDHMRFALDCYDPTVFAGEPIQVAIDRITSFVMDVTKEAEGPFLFVGHGTSLTAAIQSLAGKSLSQLRQMGGLKNNSLSILETPNGKQEGPFSLTLWNEDSFLHK